MYFRSSWRTFGGTFWKVTGCSERTFWIFKYKIACTTMYFYCCPDPRENIYEDNNDF